MYIRDNRKILSSLPLLLRTLRKVVGKTYMSHEIKPRISDKNCRAGSYNSGRTYRRNPSSHRRIRSHRFM